MSDTTTPTPQPGKPQVSKTAGCFGLIILLTAIGWIADEAGCNKPDNSVQQRILKEMGPDNPMAKRINGLNQDNAYGAGMADGSREAMEVSVKLNWGRYDYQEKLAELREGKSSVFDLLGSQNHFDPLVFQNYRSGWDRGASSLNIR